MDDEAVPAEAESGSRRLKLPYAATCSVCGVALAKRAEAFWERGTREVRCLVCGSGAELALELAGEGGGSALAEGRRRAARREERTKDAFGNLIGGLVLKLTDEPQSTASWLIGGEGERRLAAFLGRELGEEAIVLNDRRIPGSRANIDHVVVSGSGVWVVDAKAYEGRVKLETRGPIWNLKPFLQVGRRDCTKLVLAMPKQVEGVRAALASDPLADNVAVRGILCFVDSEWGFFAKPIQFGDVSILLAAEAPRPILGPGGLTREAMVRLANRIAVALPPAAG